MRLVLHYSGLILLLLLITHGAIVSRKEWRIKSVHDHGQLIEVKIGKLDCTQKMMSFLWDRHVFQKKIDARSCVVFNEGQKIRLKHDQQYADTFLFVNERSPNLLILGALEIILGIIGLMANWPFLRK